MKNRRHTTAFTLVELLVAIAIALIVTVAVYGLYSTYVRAFIAQDRVVETQQAARIAIDTLTQDLLRAGYQLPGTQPAITYAASSVLEIEYFNEQARNADTGAPEPQMERVRYFVDASNNLVRQVYRGGGPWTLVSQLSGVLAENVRFQDLDEDGVQDPGEAPALQFTYYRATDLANPASPTSLNVTTPLDADSPPEAGATTDVNNLRDIRQVQVVLTVRSAQRDPVTGRFVYRTLRADVKPRNAGLMAALQDNTPPAVPTGLLSVDRGDCGYLYVSWNENSEPDLAGYILYYGTSPGIYLNSVNIGRGVAHSAASPYALSGLVDGTQYYIAVAAFDYSGNSSALSPEVTTGVGSNDTTPNVANPDSAPAAFNGVPGELRVALSWDKVNEPDIAGYRIYRKTTPFTSSDLSAIRANNLAGIDVILTENSFTPTLSPSVVQTATGFSYVDQTNLKGCTDYYYAITAIKGCNHPISSYPDSLFARTGPDQPTDSTPPDPAQIAAYPSYLRNYLNLTNPTNIDFTHTRIAYKTGPAGSGNYPVFSKNPTTGAIETDGTFVECYNAGYGPGSFTGAGTEGILHKGLNGTCATAYSLDPSVTYYYRAVAVDTCRNLSNYAQTASQVAATQCGDETEPGHPAVGNPPKVTGIHGNTKRSAGGVTTSEAKIEWTPIDDSFNAIRDLAGYYVFRTVSAAGSTTPPGTPTRSNIDDTKGLLLRPSVFYTGLEEGRINKIRALGVDCETVTKDDASHTFLASRYPDAEFDAKASDTLIFYPGTLLLDTTVATKTLGKTQNIVEFQTRTTINAAATPTGSDKILFKTLTFDWTTPNGGLGTDRVLKSVTVQNGTTTFKRTFATPRTSPATFDAVDDGGVRMGFRGATNAVFQLEFYNSSTGSPSKADMRKLRIDAVAVYVPVTRLNSDTAPPFVFDAAQEATVSFSVPATRGPEIDNVVHRIAGSSASFTPASTTVGAVVFASAPIEVAADVIDNSGRGLERVRLFYAVTDKLTLTAPSLGSGFPTTIGSSYVPVTICDSDSATAAPNCGGSANYKGQIPAQSDRRVWFFILVEDKSGNYGVSPPQETTDSNVTYTYDQAAAAGGPL